MYSRSERFSFWGAGRPLVTSIKSTIPEPAGIAQYRAKLRKAGTEMSRSALRQIKPAGRAENEIQFN
jgi:hypothetical protein